MTAPKTIQSGEESTRQVRQGKWLRGQWCYGGGEISMVEPGDRLTLRAYFELRKNGEPPASVEFKIYAEVAKKRDLPDEPLFTVAGIVGDDGAKADWQVPMDREDWPANLMFVPVAAGFKEAMKWKTPLVAISDAWDLETTWEPGRAEPGDPATLSTVIHGLKPGDEVTFKVCYRDDSRLIDLQAEDATKGYPNPEATAKLEPIDDGPYAGKLQARAPWTIPSTDQLRELAEQAAQTPAEDGEAEAPQAAFAIPRVCHTLVLKMSAGSGDNALTGTSDLSVQEPPFILSQ